jgi:hypothetical protein
MWAPWKGAEYTIRGKVVASPKFELWWVLCVRVAHGSSPKVLQLCTNHLVWVVCRPVWVSEACQLFLVPSRNSNTPFYPSKCCELGSVPQLLPIPLSCTWIHFWVLQGVGSASPSPSTFVVVKQLFVPLLPVLWNDYTWRYICY